MNEKILVVDDEKEIADLLEVYLNITIQQHKFDPFIRTTYL